MANKALFGSKRNVAPVADTFNDAGGKAYKMSDKHALAQIAATNCFNSTYYASAEEHLDQAIKAAQGVDGEFLAKCVLYSRFQSKMKDMPAFLLVQLSQVDKEQFKKLFPLVINNGKMIRNFVQIARSGTFGKKINLSTRVFRGVFKDWFNNHSPTFLLNASVGNDPTLADIIKMSRPKPDNDTIAATLKYFINKNDELEGLPREIRQYEHYRKNKEGEFPTNLDFRLLDNLGLSEEHWTGVALNSGWNAVRMNLNTFARHGVFHNKTAVEILANKLRDPENVAQFNVFPYQLMTAWQATCQNDDVPKRLKDALQDALELSLVNVPQFSEDKVYVCIDTSGSMQSAVTGTRKGSTSVTKCVEVAALIASAILKKNNTDVIPFDTKVNKVFLNDRDSVVTNSQKLSLGGGGTDCSCALRYLNQQNARGNLVVFVSDYESWVDGGGYNRSTGLMSEWITFKRNNPKAKLVCIDLTPRNNSQVTENKDILQIGGFSDKCFDVIDNFIKHGDNPNFWVSEIEKVNISDLKRNSD
jgi:60 kDa SS-A/Ro ribonucleoprotein